MTTVPVCPQGVPPCTVIPYQDYFCNPSGDDLIETVDDPHVKSVQECQHSCSAKNLCSVFTFFNFRHKPVCHLLRDCKEKVRRPVPMYTLHIICHLSCQCAVLLAAVCLVPSLVRVQQER